METLYIFTLLFAAAFCHNHGPNPRMMKKAICEIAEDTGMPGYLMSGKITFTQMPGMNVTIHVELKGFNNSDEMHVHGFHIHDKGLLENGCAAAEGHFNPYGVVHGAPDAAVRHVGDLGNIYENGSDSINTTFTDHKIQLSGNDSIIGRSVVVHAGEDDLGLVDNDGSRATGNAGGRIGCCLIEAMHDDDGHDDDDDDDRGTTVKDDINAGHSIKSFSWFTIVGFLVVLLGS